MYNVKSGDSISDVSLNGCGSIAAWEDILNLNEFTDWTPVLTPGQELEIPAIVDPVNQSILQQYPANNDPGVDLKSLLSDFIILLDSAVFIEYPLPEVARPFLNYYTVRNGETITDVLINATGTIDNWSPVLEANQFTDWTPLLITGEKLIIPSGIEIQTNVLKQATIYPSNNDPGISNLDTLISNFIALLGGMIIFTADNNSTATADSLVLTVDQNI